MGSLSVRFQQPESDHGKSPFILRPFPAPQFGAATILGSTEPPGSPASPSAPPDDAPAADPQYAAFLASTMDALLAGREPVTYAQAVQDASQGPESVYVYQGVAVAPLFPSLLHRFNAHCNCMPDTECGCASSEV